MPYETSSHECSGCDCPRRECDWDSSIPLSACCSTCTATRTRSHFTEDTTDGQRFKPARNPDALF